MTTLGEWIARERELRNLSQRALARRAEVAQSYLSRLERDQHERPSLDILVRLANALDTDIATVLQKAGYADERITLPISIGQADPMFQRAVDLLGLIWPGLTEDEQWALLNQWRNIYKVQVRRRVAAQHIAEQSGTKLPETT